MLKKIFFCLLAACVMSGLVRTEARNDTVSREWGRVFGTAHTDRDFLIYDATCSQGEHPAIYIVGKAEAGTGFELKQGENTYFHAKDEYTDAFLACMSLDGELLWSTYLPALENGYYNAFSTTIEYTNKSTILVVGNAYQVQNDLENTKNIIPKCPGKLFLFEFDTTGQLISSKYLTIRFQVKDVSQSLYIPRIIKSVSYSQTVSIGSDHSFTGVALCNFTEGTESVFYYSCPFTIDFFQSEDVLNVPFYSMASDIEPKRIYVAAYNLRFDEFIMVLREKQPHGGISFNCLSFCPSLHSQKKPVTPKAHFSQLSSRGINLLQSSPIFEQWYFTTGSRPIGHENSELVEGTPKGTYVINTSHQKKIFPGTVQNIQTYMGKYIVQGVHCQNYCNGFFKTYNDFFTQERCHVYSHDSLHPIPSPTKGFYQSRNSRFTAVPYLLIYDSARLFETQYPDLPTTQEQEDTDSYDFEAPLWGSYIDADWLYEDIFHVTDSAQWKDIYQPYEPVVCSFNNKFFVIGNARQIGLDLVDNPPMTEEIYHHQGVILAFQTECPPERTTFENVPFLCPSDSVELRMPEEYTGFKFNFDTTIADNAHIILNANSTRAWVKQEGTYRAVLNGSAIGCPDATVDSVRITLSPYPEPISALPEDTLVSCAAFEPLINAVTQHDTSFSYRWYNGDTLWQKNCAFAGDSLQLVSVTVNGYCTSFTDTAFVRFLPPYVNLGNDTLICHTGMPADTALLLHLDANQDYFPAADWIFRWHINKREAGRGDSLLLHFADLDSLAPDRYQAIASVSVALSDTATDGCTASDTISLDLFVLPDTEGNVFLPKDSILCAHRDLELQLPDESGNFHCFWLDRDSIVLPFGEDTNRFVVQGLRGTDGFGANTDSRNPRFFQLQLAHRQCPAVFFDTMLVYDQVKPAFELPFHDTVICLNEPVALDSLNIFVYRPFYGFEWNDGTAGSGYSFSDSGTYILRFFVRGDFDVCGYGEASDTLRIKWSDPALTLISIPEDTSFCEKLSVTLDASMPFPVTRYSWQEGNLDDLVPPTEDSTLFTSPVLKVDREVSYGLFLLDTLGCLNTRQINIHEEDCKPKLEIPNVFTPNGDGVNDVWRFTQLEKCYQVDIIVVDRKGSHVLHEKVGHADDFSWNGCYRNGSKKMPDGPYFYMVSYKDAYGKKKVQSGSVTILGTAE